MDLHIEWNVRQASVLRGLDRAMVRMSLPYSGLTRIACSRVHFIPLSLGYEELFNIWAYFTGLPEYLLRPQSDPRSSASSKMYDEEGDRALRRIAEAGRQWKHNHAQELDMEVYAYRLCLEWARLWHRDLEDMDYHGAI